MIRVIRRAAWLLLALACRAGAQCIAPPERAAVDSGRQVVVTEDVPGSHWPRITVLRFIDARPEEVAAVFADYERHVTYVPDVLLSKISRVVDAATRDVDYVMHVPIFADEAYTVRDRVSRAQAGRDSTEVTYRVAWTLVRATSTRAADGEARFEPYRHGTLLTYCNLVVPGSRLAGVGFVRERARRAVEGTVRAIGEQVVRERSGNPALLRAQVRALRTMLGDP